MFRILPILLLAPLFLSIFSMAQVLPPQDDALEVATQEDPENPGPRAIRILIHYPGGELSQVGERTGLMLSLHNWGGTDCRGTPDPKMLAERYNVVAICVNYLDSGEWSPEGGRTYDFGFLQAIDALTALHTVYAGLQEAGTPFAKDRLYACGGSGGGNVTLMTHKFAPRTFACIVDFSGMARLTDDIAFGLEGGSRLDAGYSRDPESAQYLSPASQEIRWIGNPEHLSILKDLGNTTKILVVHGAADDVCLTADAREMVNHFESAGLDVEARFIGEEDLDGEVFQNTGHSIGSRDKMLQTVADKYLLPDSEQLRVRTEPNDFDLQDEAVRYAVTGGEFVVSYIAGAPAIRFIPDSN